MYRGLGETPGLPSGKGTGSNPIALPGVGVTAGMDKGTLLLIVLIVLALLTMGSGRGHE